MKNRSILLVDDNEIVLNSFGEDLRRENFDVTLASSGEKAFDLLEENKFDLVVTDLLMDEIDGIQVLQKVKKLNFLTGVIILTGDGDMTSAIEALRLGADDYLLKPCDSNELIIRIERCIAKLAALKKIQFYENILPVCMYCKSIRDDGGVEPGKGPWLKMEKYIHKQNGTNVSHGCCPRCYEKHKDD